MLLMALGTTPAPRSVSVMPPIWMAWAVEEKQRRAASRLALAVLFTVAQRSDARVERGSTSAHVGGRPAPFKAARCLTVFDSRAGDPTTPLELPLCRRRGTLSSNLDRANADAAAPLLYGAIGAPRCRGMLMAPQNGMRVNMLHPFGFV